MTYNNIICDHCNLPILEDSVHVTIDRQEETIEGFFHMTCLTSAIEMYVVRNICKKSKNIQEVL